MGDEGEVTEAPPAPKPQHGVGTFVYPDGSRYGKAPAALLFSRSAVRCSCVAAYSPAFALATVAEGEWASGEDGIRKRQGKGVFDDGVEKYDGSWEDDKMSGEGASPMGSLCRHSSDTQRGPAGSFVFASGAKYAGGFVDNKFEGEGQYDWPDGASYR